MSELTEEQKKKNDELKKAVAEMKVKIATAKANPNVLTGAPTIPEGSYVATFELKKGVPTFEVTPLPGTKFSKSSVPMNLTAVEGGTKKPKQDVSYNDTLEPILLKPEYWEQQFMVHTEARISQRNNPYQVIIFDGVLEDAKIEG